jgi:hypothetical protein
LGEIVFFGAVVLFVLFGPWVLVWRGRLKRKQEQAEDQERWRYLSNRVLGLEAAVHEWKSAAARSSVQQAPPKSAPLPKPVSEPVRPPAPEPATSQQAEAALPSSPVTSAEIAAAEPWAKANLPPSPPPIRDHSITTIHISRAFARSHFSPGSCAIAGRSLQVGAGPRRSSGD